MHFTKYSFFARLFFFLFCLRPIFKLTRMLNWIVYFLKHSNVAFNLALHLNSLQLFPGQWQKWKIARLIKKEILKKMRDSSSSLYIKYNIEWRNKRINLLFSRCVFFLYSASQTQFRSGPIYMYSQTTLHNQRQKKNESVLSFIFHTIITSDTAEFNNFWSMKLYFFLFFSFI